MDPMAAVASGFTLGLASGGYCFWSCAAVMGPYMVCTSPAASSTRWATFAGSFYTLAWYNLGRLLAYLGAGLAVTWLALRGATLPPVVQGVTQLVLGLLLGLVLLRRTAPAGCLPPRRRRVGALTMGLLQGLHPCPPFLAAMALTLTRPSITTGLLLFLSLFAGTALLTLPLAFIEPLRRRTWLTHLARAAGLAVCLYLVASAAHQLWLDPS